MSKEKQFVIEFIEQYRLFPCLWKIKSKEYCDRNIKSQAYDVLVEKMRAWDPEANRDSVVKKINSLRTAYRKELKKVIQCEKSGIGEEDIYVPHLWYYDLLHFLRDQEIPRQTKSNIEDTQVPGDDETTSDATHPPSNSIPSTPSSPRSPTPSSCSSTITRRPSKASRGTKNKCDEMLDVIGKRLAQSSQVPDKFASIGAAWASKLRDLEPLQAVHAEKLISDVFYEAQLGNLNRSSSIKIARHQPPFNTDPNFYTQQSLHTQPPFTTQPPFLTTNTQQQLTTVLPPNNHKSTQQLSYNQSFVNSQPSFHASNTRPQSSQTPTTQGTAQFFGNSSEFSDEVP